MIVFGFLVAAAIGTLVRARASSPTAHFDRHLWTTLGLNVAGSFALGWLHGAAVDTMVVVGVGGLGSLTTFSTFIWQVECLARRERSVRHAALFVALAVAAGVGAAALGYHL